MDPDAEAQQYASQFFKTTVITIAFTTCHHQESQKIKPYSSTRSSKPPVEVRHVTTISKKKKKIYLTFDDGPNRGTRKVYHIVKDEKVPVTMFIVGEHVYGSTFQREMWDSIVSCDNIEICNHSYTHAHNHYAEFYADPDSVLNDFERCNDSLGFHNNIIRIPGRNIWRTKDVSYTDIRKSIPAADSLKENFTVIGWDLEWHYDDKSFRLKNCADSLMKQIDSTFNKGKTKNSGHLVLLAHDQVYDDPNDSSELHLLFDKLKQNDEYSLEFISSYPGVSSSSPKQQ